jgi:uncharacterized Zn finger protein
MAVDVRAVACNYLRKGRVTVLSAITQDQPKPWHVYATVAGLSGREYAVTLAFDGIWDCTCGEAASCGHAAAVQLVTGHEGLASPARER